MRRFLTTILLSTLPLTGCAEGDNSPYDGGDAGTIATPTLNENGISIPLPPPSVTDEPGHKVNVDGEVVVDGARSLLDGAVVMAHDLVSDNEVECVLNPEDGSFHCAGLSIDTFDNCVELRVVFADGSESEPREYTAVLVTPTLPLPGAGISISTLEGCE